MAAAAQHAGILGIQRVYMAGASECFRNGFRVGQRAYGGATVFDAYPGGAAFQFVDGDGERRAQHRGVLFYLVGQFQFPAT